MSELYDKTVTCLGHAIRVTFDGTLARVYHDGRIVGEKRGEGLIEFQAAEGNDIVAYDVLVLTAGYVRIKVGRGGRVVFSDYQSFPLDRTHDL